MCKTCSCVFYIVYRFRSMKLNCLILIQTAKISEFNYANLRIYCEESYFTILDREIPLHSFLFAPKPEKLIEITQLKEIKMIFQLVGIVQQPQNKQPPLAQMYLLSD